MTHSEDLASSYDRILALLPSLDYHDAEMTAFDPTASSSSVSSRPSTTSSAVSAKKVARSGRAVTSGFRKADFDALEGGDGGEDDESSLGGGHMERTTSSASTSSPAVSVEGLSTAKPRLQPRDDRDDDRRRRQRRLFSEDDREGTTSTKHPRRHTSAATSSSSTSNSLSSIPVETGGVVSRIDCQLYMPSIASVGAGELSMGGVAVGAARMALAPLMREVPGMRKRAATSKRESAQLLEAGVEATPVKDDKGKGSLREKPSRSSLALPNGQPAWRPVTAIIRDGGLLSLIADDTVIVELSNSLVVHTDIQLVDPTLLARWYCLSIHTPALPEAASPPLSPSAPPETLTRSISSTRFIVPQIPFNLTSRSQQPQANLDMPLNSSPTGKLYLSFPSSAALSTFYATLQCYTRSPGPLPSPWPLYGPGARANEERACRGWRGIELQIVEGRSIGDRPTPSLSTSMTSSSSHYGFFDDTRSHVVGMVRQAKRAGSSDRPMTADVDTGEKNAGVLSLEYVCEVLVDGEVVGKTASKRGMQSPLWRELFTFSDLGPSTRPLEIRVYQLFHRKSPGKVLVGSVCIPLSSARRSETVEEWFPIVQRDTKRHHEPEHVGDLNLSFRFDCVEILPLREYDPLQQLLADDDDPYLPYDIVAEMPQQLERVADILIRVYHSQGTLLQRMMQMADIEIDGDMSSANILFRGKSLFTKTLELYLRLVGTDFLHASVGATVSALCAERIDIEIDPSKLRGGPMERTLAENKQDLERWTTYLWNTLYQARHKCPNELRQLFAHIQEVVETRYDARKSPMRFTSISAFVFLRFFVPALLNTKLFGLTQRHPDPACQRTLTLIAKTLQTLANMTGKFDKEPFMACMNGFIEDNAAAFIDYVSFISRPMAAEAKPGWTSPDFPAYQQARAARDSLPSEHRERVPRLPHLFDEGKELALLAALVSRSKADAVRRGGSSVDPSSASITSATVPTRHGGRSKGIDQLIEVCVELHARAASSSSKGSRSSRTSTPPPLPIDESFEMLAAPSSRGSSMSPRRTRVTTLPGDGEALNTSPLKSPLAHLTRLTTSPRSRRSHTVSSANGGPPSPPLTAGPLISPRSNAMAPRPPLAYPVVSAARFRRVSGSDQRMPLLNRARSDTVTSIERSGLLPADPIELRITNKVPIALAKEEEAAEEEEPLSPRRRLFRVRP